MWHARCISPQADSELVSSTTELLRSTSRTLVLITGGVYLAWHVVSTANWPVQAGPKVWLITPVMALTCALALRALRRRFLLAQAIWHAGLAAAITLAVYLFQQPEIAFLYVLLPLTATVTTGWPGGLIVESVLVALMGWFSCSPLGWLVPSAYRIGIIVGGGFCGLVGWASAHTLLTVTQWSLFSLAQARENMEAAFEQRVELKQTQEDLIQANRELARLSDRLKAMHHLAEEARRAKEAFVANVSHELRTPLNMIIGFSEMITQSPRTYGDTLPPALLADIAAIQRNSQHLSRLVNDVLDLSQVEAGRMALSKEWASMPEIVDTAAQTVRPLFESKKLYLETEVPADMPHLFCDSTRIRQVLINLLSNAGRFTERGGVQVKARRENADIVVSVSDTGPGIAPGDREKIFEPFRQVDESIRRRHGGSGLGLSISKQFVELHGGQVWLESEVDVGTTFYFSLPLDTPSAAVLAGDEDVRRWFSPYDQPATRTRRSRAPAPKLVPRFVLLERGESMRRLFSRYMEGVEIVSVQDIGGALDELSHSPAQALIMNAPLFDRLPASMAQLADLPYGIPAMACWTPGRDEITKRLGVVDYLVKPVSRQALLLALEELGKEIKNVLLVDDEPEALQLFARMLSSAERGYRVLRATNGEQALALLRERRPDVMLLDLIMPGMDGFRVLQEKDREATIREIPVVVVSSRDPANKPIVSNMLTVTQSGGLSARDLFACIQALSEVLSPSV